MKDENPIIGRDLLGYPFNRKYPPMPERYGSAYYGYSNWNQQAFFYEFAVQSACISFRYQDKDYYLIAEEDCAATCKDSKFTPDENSLRFASCNELIEQLEIDGHKLIDILDDLEDVDIH